MMRGGRTVFGIHSDGTSEEPDLRLGFAGSTRNFDGAFAHTVADLRAVLDAAGYSEQALRDTLALEGPLLVRRDDVTVHLRRLPAGRSSTLVKLFLLGVPVETKEAAQALKPLRLERLRSSGILAPRAPGLGARLRLVPYRGLLLACDPLHRRGAADWVDGVTSPADLLALLTVRRPVEAALDVGTGSGVQALLAARHARRIVATDINPRALAFTTLNARINGLRHVQRRLGSRFAPVAGEQFDLIVSNPPYVISPESTFLYRDSGVGADGFCRDLVRQAPRFLREGGFAHILCNWVHEPREDWWAPVRHWVDMPGVDAWILRHHSRDPLSYAAAWNMSLAATRPGEYAKTVERWLAYYRRRRISAIASGVIILRRRSAERNWIRADDFPGDVVAPAGEQIRRTFSVQDRRRTLDDDPTLLAERFRLADSQRVGQELRLDDALAFETEVDATTSLLLERCDGARRLGALLGEVAAVTRRPEQTLRATVLPTVRRLVRLGFLVATGPSSADWRGAPGRGSGRPPRT